MSTTATNYQTLVNDVAQAMDHYLAVRASCDAAQSAARGAQDALDAARAALQDHVTRDVDAVLASLQPSE